MVFTLFCLLSIRRGREKRVRINDCEVLSNETKTISLSIQERNDLSSFVNLRLKKEPVSFAPPPSPSYRATRDLFACCVTFQITWKVVQSRRYTI